MESVEESRKRVLPTESSQEQKEMIEEQSPTNLADAMSNVFDKGDDVEGNEDDVMVKKKCPILVSMINQPPRAESSDASVPSSSTHQPVQQPQQPIPHVPNPQGFVQFLMIYNAYQQLMTKCNQHSSTITNQNTANFSQNVMHSPHNSEMKKSEEVVEPKQLSETDILREATQGKYKNVLCVICNEWICARSRKNHIEAHLNYRPFKCSSCDYARRREIFVSQHIKIHHPGQGNVRVIINVDESVAKEANRLAEECVEKTKKILENANKEKETGDQDPMNPENKQSNIDDKKEKETEEEDEKVVVIESVNKIRPTVVNYHRRQRTKDLCLEKIYDSETTKQTQLMFKNETKGEGSTQ